MFDDGECPTLYCIHINGCHVVFLTLNCRTTCNSIPIIKVKFEDKQRVVHFSACGLRNMVKRLICLDTTENFMHLLELKHSSVS